VMRLRQKMSSMARLRHRKIHSKTTVQVSGGERLAIDRALSEAKDASKAAMSIR